MKPEEGRDQATTQVKGLSAEKPNNPEADMLHDHGRRNFSDHQGKSGKILAVSETVAWDQEDDLGIWETQSVIRKSGLRSNKP